MENRKCNSFRETLQKTLMKLTYPDAQARVFILFISTSVLFCFFLLIQSELWNPVGSRGTLTLCREYSYAYNFFPEKPRTEATKKCFLPFWHFHGHTWSFDMPYQSPSLCKHSFYQGECFELPGHDGWSIRR